MRFILDIASKKKKKKKKKKNSGWLMGAVCKAQREKTGCAAALGTEFFEEKSKQKKIKIVWYLVFQYKLPFFLWVNSW